MTRFNRPLVALGALIALMLGQGALAEVNAEVASSIKARLAAANPQASFGEVRKSPMAGIYEVDVAGGGTLFVSEDGSHFVVGDLYQASADGFVNVSEQRRTGQRARIMGEQKLDEMIVFSPKGKPKAHIYVFTDVDCGYCRKLHQDVPELNKRGVEVRYLAYPRTGTDSLGYRKLVTAWCAKDPQKALTALKNRENVPLSLCDNHPVLKQYELGNGPIDVRGTPTIVMQDGRVVPGYLPPQALAKELGI